MTEATGPIGILVMAYGGPDSLDDVPGYVADIRAGRTTPRRIVERIADNYRQIGGASPLKQHTLTQIDGLSRLATHPTPFRFYLGMRHWAPWIEDTVGQMIDDGITSAVSLVMAPHYSQLSVAKYQSRIERGLAVHRGRIDFRHVDSFHNHPLLIRALGGRLTGGLAQWPAADRSGVHVLMTAHSLPESIRRVADPYERQLAETASQVAQACGLMTDQWSFAFQSAGRDGGPWLGPSLEQRLGELAEAGVRNVLVLTIGFVSDHVEVLFDIDIAARRTADELGICLRRAETLGCDPTFLETLWDVIIDAARPWRPVPQGISNQRVS
jgi:ferrochelatase